MFKFLRQKFIYRRHIAGLTPSESMQGVPFSTQRSPWASPSHSILPPCGLRFSDTHVLCIMLPSLCLSYSCKLLCQIFLNVVSGDLNSTLGAPGTGTPLAEPSFQPTCWDAFIGRYIPRAQKSVRQSWCSEHILQWAEVSHYSLVRK